MPPRTEFKLPQLSLDQILKYTKLSPTERKDSQRSKSPLERSNNCSLITYQYSAGSREGFKRMRSDYPIWYNEFRGYVACRDSGEKRYSYVRFYGPPDIKTPVWVWCSCENFAYVYEWVLATYNSSTISPGYASRGVNILADPPIVRNPRRYPGMCKHLVVASRIALRQTRDLAAEKGIEALERGSALQKQMQPEQKEQQEQNAPPNQPSRIIQPSQINQPGQKLIGQPGQMQVPNNVKVIE